MATANASLPTENAPALTANTSLEGSIPSGNTRYECINADNPRDLPSIIALRLRKASKRRRFGPPSVLPLTAQLAGIAGAKPLEYRCRTR